MADVLEFPTFKGRPGWEFTDISALDVDAYELTALQPAWGSAAAGSLWDLPQSELPAGVEVSLGDGEASVTVTRGTVLEQPIALTTVVADGKLGNLRTRPRAEPNPSATQSRRASRPTSARCAPKIQLRSDSPWPHT